mmetsp:Transcript_58456/g.103360  ORF Transcript_58456/g.103360 Transcript_58456/m.103360 type:complete len:85 (+) Transcript_58456:1-255(+)
MAGATPPPCFIYSMDVRLESNSRVRLHRLNTAGSTSCSLTLFHEGVRSPENSNVEGPSAQNAGKSSLCFFLILQVGCCVMQCSV